MSNSHFTHPVKTCPRCDVAKPLDEYYKMKCGKDGLQRTCKVCTKAVNDVWKAANKARIKERMAEYRSETREHRRIYNRSWERRNRDNNLERRRRWYVKNIHSEHLRDRKYKQANRARINLDRRETYHLRKERSNANSRAWYEANKSASSQRGKAWRAANPHAARVHNGTRRSRRNGRLSGNIVARLMKLQRGMCACCRQPLGANYHLDHIMPLALGGTNTDDNVQLLRQRCNNQKHAKHPVDFMQSRGFLL